MKYKTQVKNTINTKQSYCPVTLVHVIRVPNTKPNAQSSQILSVFTVVATSPKV